MCLTKSILKKDSQYGPLLEDEKIQSPGYEENAIINKPEVFHKSIHVFPAFSSREMAPEKLIDLMNSITMDNMTKGEYELQHVSHGRHELVLHFTHSENFSTDALQEAFEANHNLVDYSFIEDPDEVDSYCEG